MSREARKSAISRRRVIAGIAAGSAALAGGIYAPAIAQGPTHIKMTLPWLPQGSQLFAFVARNRGMWSKRGLDVDIRRGFGSIAALQTITQNQIEVGIIAAPTILLAGSQGIDTKVVGVIGYDTTMGVMTLEDSPLKTLKDFEGKKLGSGTASAELPFLDPFFTRSGVDPTKITRVVLQPNVLESALMNRQVDAISVFATSNMPNILAHDIKVRFFPYSAVGLRFYSNCLTTLPSYLAANRSVVEAWADGLNEAAKFSATNFVEAVDIFVSEVPEVKSSATGEVFTKYGAGMFLATLLQPELKEHGFGWGDPASLKNQAELALAFLGAKDATMPDIGTIFSNDMSGKYNLDATEWKVAAQSAAPFAEILNMKI